MNNFLNAHSDMEHILKNNPNLKTYKYLDDNGKYIECWEKNEEGHWIDVTEREKLKEEIALAQSELERIKEINND